MEDNICNFSKLHSREIIKKLPGFKIHWACQKLLSCYSIMINNGFELIKYSKEEHDFHFQLLPNSKSRLIKIEKDYETLRLIHNFVASVKTLVDISRNYSNKYTKGSSSSEYQEVINKKVIPSTTATFIFDLRNFMLHREMPVIGHGINPMTGISNCIFLHTPSLLEWTKWKALSHAFIITHNKKDKRILIDELTKKYLILSQEVTKILFNSIVNSNTKELNIVYSEIKNLTKKAQTNGMITDPLIVQFFTEEGSYLFPRVTVE